MQKKSLITLNFFIAWTLSSFGQQTSNTIPVVTTISVTSITTTLATINAEVNNQGGGTVTERGAVWNTSGNPTVNSNRVPSGSGTGVYTATITGLSAGSNYYVRAYAINNFGISYGVEIPFTTLFGLATLTTNNVIAQSITASSGGNITDNGGSTVTARGVVWNTTGTPTISGSKTMDGSGTGSYFSNMTALSPSTTYYVRAYATTSTGTAYGNQQTFTTTATSQTLTDIDGNTYNTVQIGTQIWMSENLKTSRYRNGGSIPYVVGNSDWQALTTGAWSNYNHDAANDPIYGKLYNWYTTLGDTLCPTGWGVPTDAEWTTLTTYLGGESVAGGKMKSVGTAYWNDPNTGATNESGFSVLPGGFRNTGGSFLYVRNFAFFWSATEYYSFYAWYRSLDSSYGDVARNGNIKSIGAAVRCLKDSSTTTAANLPTISTIQGTEITSISAKSGGNVSSYGGAAVTSRGVVWSTSTNPTISLTTKTSDGSGTGSFSSTLTGLTPNTTYYIRAYATNSAGTAYGNEVTFTTTNSNNVTGIPCSGIPTVKDIDGNTYNTVQIGTQCWTKENLKVTKYNDGTAIPDETANTAGWEGLATGARSDYTGVASYIATYGYLYNWYAAKGITTPGSPTYKNLCPTGWHVPSDAEWTILTTYLGGQGVAGVAGGKMKSVGTAYWNSPNTGATNESGFSALPAGYRSIDGSFYSIRFYAYFWSATENSSGAYGYSLDKQNGIVYRGNFFVIKSVGASIRCLRDSTSTTTGSIPTISTIQGTEITSISAKSGGNITSDGGASITNRGVVWSTSTNPTISLSTKTTDGTGSSTFVSNLINLNPNTTYYIRAYATNSVGTAYGNEVTFTTTNSTNMMGIPCPGIPSIKDIDGNTYNTVQIGTQCWTKENLKVSKYNDGTNIPLDATGGPTGISAVWSGLTIGSYTIYGNESSSGANATNYGFLYNWYAATDSRKLCPTGWHVPTDGEWTSLTTYLGGESVAGGKMKSVGTTYWNSPNTGATNESGFSALPGGARYSGGYSGIRGNAFFWSANEFNNSNALYRDLDPGDVDVYRFHQYKSFGTSVRCLRDSNSMVSIPKLTTTAITEITTTSATSGGSITADGSAPIIARGVVWSTTTNPNISLTTKTTDESGLSTYVSNLTNLSPNTTYYIRAYATNSAGTAYGNEFSFTTNALCSGCVLSKTGKIWMDRNLGASRVATSSIDAESFGALYQWGRGTDGHQNLPFYDASALTRTLSGTDSPGHSKFILNSTPPDDWRSPQNDNLWQGASGKNNPCPSGFRLPTYSEFDAERAIFSTQDAAGAFASALKLPMGGYRSRVIGDNNGKFTVGNYWTSTVIGVMAQQLAFNNSVAFLGPDTRSNGMSVRCIKDSISTTTASIPTISTIQGTEITSISAKSGGNITSDGGASITNRGVVWSTSTNPTISLSTKTSDGTGWGTYVSNLTNLNPNTTYYIRAYATNSAGTGYGNEVTFTTTNSNNVTGIPCSGIPTVKDIDGNTYNTVQIGTQCWTKENLKVTKYRNGTPIPTRLDSAGTIHNNDPANEAIYGKLYNWYAVVNYRGLCPIGWHVPTDAEWTTLTTYLGGLGVAGGKMKSTGITYWSSPNTGATNESGFSALPSGYVESNVGLRPNGRGSAFYWSATESGFGGDAWSRKLNDYDGFVNRSLYNWHNGFSVRCLRDTNSIVIIPKLTTTAITAITTTSATSGGSITADGSAPITARGVVWSTTTNPTISLTTKTTDGTGTGSFPSSLSSLSPNTTYYVRAYATNSAGTGYGNEITFTTRTQVVLPTISTLSASSITTTTATTGGNVSFDGGATITSRGVVWSTSSAPTISLSTKTSDGSGTGSFSSALSSLLPSTTYYVRAYATNSAGTAYGNEITFTTSPKNPNTVVFYTPYFNVTCDTLIEMPLLVNNFIGIIGAQGSINWDSTKLKYEGINSFGPSSLKLTLSDFGITDVLKGKLSFVWYASNSSAITLADSTSFFVIKFKLINSKETSASVKISNDPIDIELLNSNYEKINYEIGNYFSNQACFKVSGKIQNPKGLNIPGVTVSLSNSGGSKTTSTDVMGDFSFTNHPIANYSLIPSKLAESNSRSGISIFDLALIQAHIIGKKPLETAYQIISADINGSSTITTADLIMLKKFILGSESNINGRLYSFVDKKHVFSNPKNPFPFPQSIIIINSTQNLVVGDFIGVKVGDINLDNIPQNFEPKENRNRKIEFLYEILSPDLSNRSNEVIYRIKSAKEQDLLGMQFTLNWNSKLADMLAIENNPLGFDFANVSGSNGLLGLGWISNNGLSKILNENEVVFEIRLKLKSKFNKPALNMNDELLEKEAFDDNFNLKELSLKLDNNLDANDLSQYKLFVFPNPAQNNFTLTFNSNKAEKGFVQVTDMLGRLIINQEVEINKGLNNRLFNIPDHIVTGIYNIQLRTSKNFENLNILLKNKN
jgi:uncharacterized protein (TIGR02145 family)